MTPLSPERSALDTVREPLPMRTSHVFAARRVAVTHLQILFAALLAGCSSSTAPEWRRVVGVVSATASDGPALEAPAGAYAGDDVLVTVRTMGSSGCTRSSGAEVRYQEALVEITPYDWAAPDGTACARDWRSFPRTVKLRFSGHGSYVIRVSGRAESGELVPGIVEVPIAITGRD